MQTQVLFVDLIYAAALVACVPGGLQVFLWFESRVRQDCDYARRIAMDRVRGGGWNNV